MIKVKINVILKSRELLETLFNLNMTISRKAFIKLISTKLIKESSETMHETIKGALFLIEDIVRPW
jgi:hypothetical protein